MPGATGPTVSPTKRVRAPPTTTADRRSGRWRESARARTASPPPTTSATARADESRTLPRARRPPIADSQPAASISPQVPASLSTRTSQDLRTTSVGGVGGTEALAGDSLFVTRAVDRAGGSSAGAARSTETQLSSGPAGGAEQRGGAPVRSEAAHRDAGGGGSVAGVGRSGTRRDLVVAPAVHVHRGLRGEVTAELSAG